MKTTTTFAALLICVCFAAVASAQYQPNAMMISNDGLTPRLQPMPKLDYSKYLGLTVQSHNGRGLKVHSTDHGGAAATVGLEPGDIILGAEGYYINSLQELESALNTGWGKTTVTVRDIRTGRQINAVMPFGSNGGSTTGTAAGYDPEPGVGLELLLR